jgi:hypothetical protein
VLLSEVEEAEAEAEGSAAAEKDRAAITAAPSDSDIFLQILKATVYTN